MNRICCVKDFYFLHVNIRSIKKHFSEFLVTINDSLKLLDVLVITEPNISYSFLPLYKITGFNINVYMRKGRTGGGVIVYSRNNLPAAPCDSLALSSVMRSAECVSIELKCNNVKIM